MIIVFILMDTVVRPFFYLFYRNILVFLILKQTNSKKKLMED